MRVLAWLAAFALATCACCAGAVERAELDRIFDDVMHRYELPGLAVGVIEEGRIVYARTAGERVAGSGQPITRRTLFKIASNSKAMTAATLARLVDAGKLRWDDPVVHHLPTFRLFDDWVTRNIQVQDLLVHNSGLPEGGGDLMLWPEPNRFTRADILAGLAHIRPAYGFRAGYAYDNLLYVVAGEVAAAAGDGSYEALVRREVFEPLGLGCRVGAWRREAGDDVAQPHLRRDGRNLPSGVDGDAVPAITSAAAGGIRCSLDDMLRWALVWLAPGEREHAWLSAAQREAMWKPRTTMPVSARSKAWDGTHYRGYALGFRVADADGEWTVSHTGTLSGMYSVLFLLPDRRGGFVMLTNGEGGEARTVVTEALLKRFTRPDDTRRVADFAADLARDRTVPGRSRVPDTASRVPVEPERIGADLGIWRDPWFGDVAICARSGKVRFESAKSPRMAGTVMRVGERLLVEWDSDAVDVEPWLDFGRGERAGTLAMAKVDPDGDFSSDYEDLALRRLRVCREASP